MRIPALRESRTPLTTNAPGSPTLYVARIASPTAMPNGVLSPNSTAPIMGMCVYRAEMRTLASRAPIPRPSNNSISC